MFFDELILIMLLMNNISCDCGPAGKPIGADVYGIGSVSPENKEIAYECKDEFRQIYGTRRTCIRGKWTGRVPKCVLRLSSKLVIEKIEIKYLDKNPGLETVFLNETFEEFSNNCDRIFNQTKNLNLKIYYSPKHKISIFEITFEDLLKKNEVHSPKSEIQLKVFVTSFRNCIVDETAFGFGNRFVCELNSIEYSGSETNVPEVIQLSFNSKEVFKLRLCNLYVFQFQDDCGIPDIPLHSSTQNTGKTVVYYPTIQERYRMIGENTINCISEGNWDKEPPIFEPTIKCISTNFNLSAYKSIKFENFEFFNETQVAVIGSRIKFKCNDSGNSSKFLVSICDENGSWIGDDFNCEYNNTLIDDRKYQAERSQLFPIIITLISTFVLTLIICAIIGAVIIFRNRKLRKNQIKSDLKNANNVEFEVQLENYDHIHNEYDENRYETMNFDEENYDFREYHQINYDRLNVEENKTVEYLEIIE